MTPGAIESGLRDLVRELVAVEVERRLATVAPPEPTSENMTTRDAAAYLKVGKATLEQMRARGKGPPYTRAGRRVLYRRAEVDAWLAGGGR